MRKFLLLTCCIFFITILSAQFTLSIQTGNIPPEPKNYTMYMAGSFNGWNPADEKFMFHRNDSGQYYIEIKLPAGTYEYKITRGSWKDVECGVNGTGWGNRELTISGDETITINIAAWKDNFPEKIIQSTVSKNVIVMDTAFYMPRLQRKRRILIYLPEGYTASKNRYPVLYMHDGQNLFDEKTSFAGEWGVDEFMDSVKNKKMIVVAIDNGGKQRTNEYSPYDFSLIPDLQKINKGEGKEYAGFLVKTLKPFIDKKFRTLKDKNNTLIAGSSMGGLISLYAVLTYPDVFGGAGIFSPSVWICRKQLLEGIKLNGKKVNTKIYFYCGKKESTEMVPDMLRAFQQLAAVSKSKMITVIRDDGKHNEPAWRKEFPAFYEWVNRQIP
jgi:predicted alpha/beta superfamily hydrolase